MYSDAPLYTFNSLSLLLLVGEGVNVVLSVFHCTATPHYTSAVIQDGEDIRHSSSSWEGRCPVPYALLIHRTLSTGIEPHGNTVLKPAHFTVETIEAGLGEVLVYIEDPEGHTEEVLALAAALLHPTVLPHKKPQVL